MFIGAQRSFLSRREGLYDHCSLSRPCILYGGAGRPDLARPGRTHDRAPLLTAAQCSQAGAPTMTYENISFVGFCSQAITKQLVLGSIVAGITLFAAIDRIDTIWSISYVIVPHKANNNSCRHSIFPVCFLAVY